MDERIFKLLLFGIIFSYQVQITYQARNGTCRSRVSSDTMLESFCQLAEPGRQHKKLSCLRNEEVVITDVIQGIKKREVCTRQVIGHDNMIFCCKRLGSDILMDANCLRHQSPEAEYELYTKALLAIVSTCSQRRTCVLNSTSALLIPRGVQSLDKFSTYVQVAYTCYREQPNRSAQVNFCSAVTGNGSSVFLRTPLQYSEAPENSFNCSCTVTSSSRVVVTALDVRLGYNQSVCSDVELMFKNQTTQSFMTCQQDNLIFGSKMLFVGDKAISVHLNRLHKLHFPSMVWLNISAVDGSLVTVLCSEPKQPRPSEVPPVPHIEANREIEYGFTYWSFVFGIIGVIGACCTMGIALAIFLTCRRRYLMRMLRSRDEKYDLEPQYATVADYIHHDTPMRMSRNSLYSQKKLRNFSSECDIHDCYDMNTIEKRPPLPPSPPPKTYEMYRQVKGKNSEKVKADVTVTATNVDFIDSPTSDERLISENEDAEGEVPENIMVTKL